MDISELYMARCLELAGHGRGSTAPNPMVGSVVVHDGRIIGEGYHHRCGEAHAEVNAISSVRDDFLLRNSTLYVSLEPCSHYGKTPPCAELIIRKGIPRVVVACLDPFPQVAGCGVDMLRKAGVEVVTGVMEREAIDLNAYFMTAHKKHRPYIILKWAQSEDGFIDRVRKDVSEKPVLLSTTVTRMMVHKLRSEVQAIMVGTNTAILDNPSLTVRYWSGKSPIRILVDRQLRVSEEAHLYDGKQQTFIFTEQEFKSVKPDKNRIEYVKIENSTHFLRNLTQYLYERDVHSLLVEGGARLHHSFIEEDLWDEIIVETAPVRLGNGVESIKIPVENSSQLSDKYIVPKCFDRREKPSLIERYLKHDVLKNKVSYAKIL